MVAIQVDVVARIKELMATKYKPLVDQELIRSIIGAQRGLKKALKNEPVTFQHYTKIIRSWQRELLRLRKANKSERVIRNAEIILAFMKNLHQENTRKYESYRKGDPRNAATDETVQGMRH